uniref:Uncharacterized protein n=1 Tax=Heterorhabditis bacteriophora TaxID=37862 RepID=A0A1I7WM96_HETBA
MSIVIVLLFLSSEWRTKIVRLLILDNTINTPINYIIIYC